MKEQEGAARPLGRRQFFKATASAGAAAAAGAMGVRMIESSQAEAAVPPVNTDSPGDLIARMQAELEQVVASGRRPGWLMVVDTRKCIGCNACTAACRVEVPAGPAGALRRVIQIRLTLTDRPISIFKPFNCLQCDNPPCQRAVPAGMIRKRPDGIVELDQTVLRGDFARAAAAACPFQAMHVDDGRNFTEGTPAPQAYEERSFTEYGRSWQRKPGANALQNAARKCTFCSHLLEQAILPACVTTCIGGAMYFGDGNDPSSLVNEVTLGRRRFAGHDAYGVQPRVIYLEEPMPEASSLSCQICHY